MTDWGTIIKALAVLGGAGLLIAVLLLLVVRLKRSIRVDKREAAVRAVLPKANCGACGFPRCNGYAAAVAAGKAPLNACVVRVPDVTHRIGDKWEAVEREIHHYLVGATVAAAMLVAAYLVWRRWRRARGK